MPDLPKATRNVGCQDGIYQAEEITMPVLIRLYNFHRRSETPEELDDWTKQSVVDDVARLVSE